MRFSCAVVLLSLALLPASAAGALVNMPDSVLDTSTRLRWLDLTLSSGTPYNEVDAIIGLAGPFPTYDVVTADQVVTLLGHLGLPAPDFRHFQQVGWGPWERDVSFAAANRFVDLFGQTGLIGFPPPFRASAGVFAVDFGNPLNVFMYEVMAGPLDRGANIGRVRAGFTGAQAVGGFGIFLARPVPEPNVLVMLIAGGLVRGACRRWHSSR